MWPLDGGLYLGTGDAVVTQCPETGRVNVGTYRMMIKGPREIGIYTSPGKDATLDREKWWKMGKPMPIAAAYGIDPLLFLVAATSFPKTECEYDYYGGINGAPIEVFKSDLTGLPLPARAEIIIEGFVYPDETFAEGPFGEFTGYYGRPVGATPYMRVEKVRFRNNPTLTCALMADGPANECGLFWAALRSAAIWSDLQKLGIPGIQGVWSIPEAAGWGITVVSIKQMYAGHAPQVMALAAQCTGGAYFGKYVIVVDDDVDPSNIHQVLWAMATRSRPAQSIDILRETWSTFLDPSLNPPEIRPWGSKALINACMDYRHIKTFSKRTKLSKPMYEQVAARWNELGFAGKPMEVSVFEDAAPGTRGRVGPLILCLAISIAGASAERLCGFQISRPFPGMRCAPSGLWGLASGDQRIRLWRHAPPISIARSLSLRRSRRRGWDGATGLPVVDDGVGAASSRCPTGQRSKPQASNNAGERVPDVRGTDRGFLRQRAGAAHLDHWRSRAVSQATSTLRTSVCGARRAAASAGGVRGCRIPRWSRMKRVSGWRSINVRCQHRGCASRGY